MIILTKAAERSGMPAEWYPNQRLAQDQEGTNCRESLKMSHQVEYVVDSIKNNGCPLLYMCVPSHALSCWLSQLSI